MNIYDNLKEERIIGIWSGPLRSCQSQEFRFLLDIRDPRKVFEQGSDTIHSWEQCSGGVEKGDTGN